MFTVAAGMGWPQVTALSAGLEEEGSGGREGGRGGGVGRRKKGGIEGVGERESENDKKQAWRPHNKKPESELGSGPSCDPRGWGAQFWDGLLRLQLRYHS